VDQQPDVRTIDGLTIDTGTVTWVNTSPGEIFHGTLGPDAHKITYHLNDAFAGSTVTLEWDQGMAVAQITINGSGVPIIVCVRSPASVITTRRSRKWRMRSLASRAHRVERARPGSEFLRAYGRTGTHVDLQAWEDRIQIVWLTKLSIWLAVVLISPGLFSGSDWPWSCTRYVQHGKQESDKSCEWPSSRS
jgi:hypothetical protein